MFGEGYWASAAVCARPVLGPGGTAGTEVGERSAPMDFSYLENA